MIQFKTHSEKDTSRLGQDFGIVLRPGDLLFLSGDLGVGKSVLARSIIRYLAKNDELEVPSPTYTLCQSYDIELPIAHFDLYRLSGMDELEELGWEDMLDEGCVLVEWPEQAFDKRPQGAVQINISDTGDTGRTLEILGEGNLYQRIERSIIIRNFLEQSSFKSVDRSPLMGDASARSYELIDSGNEADLLLMNAPALPDGPPIRDGKPYSKIAHLAEDVTAFVAIDELLRDKGFAAPELKAQDLDEGLLLIEHFGNSGIIDAERRPITERYMAAIEFLAALHEAEFENNITLKSGEPYQIPTYDEQAMLIEVDLLLKWYAPSQSQTTISQENEKAFEAIWQGLYQQVDRHEKSLVLRDYHSPNILWREGEVGINQIGVIDFQDAVIGPATYDVASLAQDARVDVSEALENQLIEHYIHTRQAGNTRFDVNGFRESYAIMAAQRATKILGIFIRLNERDGKPAYLKHLPRIEAYLKRSLKHPILVPYKAWLTSVIKM